MNVFTQTLRLDNYQDWPLLKKLEGERKGHPYGVYLLNDMKVQIIQECEGKNHYDAHNIYNDIRIFNNRYPEWDWNTHTFIDINKESLITKVSAPPRVNNDFKIV